MSCKGLNSPKRFAIKNGNLAKRLCQVQSASIWINFSRIGSRQVRARSSSVHDQQILAEIAVGFVIGFLCLLCVQWEL